MNATALRGHGAPPILPVIAIDNQCLNCQTVLSCAGQARGHLGVAWRAGPEPCPSRARVGPFE
eukprot:1444333-Pyramimonas_sp.AAC.1